MYQISEENKKLLYNGLLRTASGKYVDVFNPTEDMIDINDIIHSLGNQCRFGGHTFEHFSVAQHCLHAHSYLTDAEKKEIGLEVLLHDAAEAYLLDLPRPVKKHIESYNQIEHNLMKVIAKKFNLVYPFPERVIEIDNYCLEIEFERFMMQNYALIFPFHNSGSAPFVMYDKIQLLLNERNQNNVL